MRRQARNVSEDEEPVEAERLAKLYSKEAGCCGQKAWSRQSGSVWTCTRERDHTGRHVAHKSSGKPVGWWFEDAPTYPVDAIPKFDVEI